MAVPQRITSPASLTLECECVCVLPSGRLVPFFSPHYTPDFIDSVAISYSGSIIFEDFENSLMPSLPWALPSSSLPHHVPLRAGQLEAQIRLLEAGQGSAHGRVQLPLDAAHPHRRVYRGRHARRGLRCDERPQQPGARALCFGVAVPNLPHPAPTVHRRSSRRGRSRTSSRGLLHSRRRAASLCATRRRCTTAITLRFGGGHAGLLLPAYITAPS